MKAHLGVDSRLKLFHSVVATPANIADSTVLPELLRGNETRVWGDQAYRGQRANGARLHQSPLSPSRHGDMVEQAKNRTESKVRAKVEHPIGVIKRVFGFAKVGYRGLKKNAHRLVVTCALANLSIDRRATIAIPGGVVPPICGNDTGDHEISPDNEAAKPIPPAIKVISMPYRRVITPYSDVP